MRDAASGSEIMLFFKEGQIVKEMTFAEFEAVLDGVVGMSDFADDEVQSAFVIVDQYLSVRGVCLFLMEFDAQGYPDARWNMPLRQLTEKGEPGLDLGGGVITFCGSGSPNAGVHARQLWGGNANEAISLLMAVRATVERNYLCLPHQPRPAHAAIPSQPHYQTQPQYQSQPGTQPSPSASVAPVDAANDGYQQLQRQYLELMGQLQSQNDTLREAEKQRSQMEAQFEERLTEVRAHAEQDQAQQVDERTGDLQSKVRELEARLSFRDDEVRSLREELTQLRKDKLRLTNQGGDKFLERLDQLGISFIAFHPGAGHVSITLADMSTYIENPIAFAARKCRMEEGAYRDWLDHYNNPVCRASLSASKSCGKTITRTDIPSLFKPGASDRCSLHQSVLSDTRQSSA